jgi:hypothetical protein
MMKTPDIATMKAAAPGTVAMIQQRLNVGCSHSHALDIVAAAHQFSDFNTAKGLAKQADAPAYDKATLTHLSQTLTELQSLTTAITQYDQLQQRVVRQLTHALSQLAGTTPTPERLTDDMPSNVLGAYLLDQLNHAIKNNTFAFTMQGADTPMTDFSGLAHYNVDTTITLGEHTLVLVYDYKTSEYVDRDEEWLDISFDGQELEDFLLPDVESNGDYGIDRCTTALMDFMHTTFDRDTPDMVNTYLSTYRSHHALLAMIAAQTEPE